MPLAGSKEVSIKYSWTVLTKKLPNPEARRLWPKERKYW